MKFKKITSIFVVIMSIFVLSTSAFAQRGTADSFDTAIPIGPGYSYYNYIEDRNDIDFLVYESTKNVTDNFQARLTSPAGYSYSVTFFIYHTDGSVDTWTNDSPGPGKTLYVSTRLNPGEKMYFAVRTKTTGSTDENYKFELVQQ